MILIIGLGNYGEQYAHTRHNAGFDTIDVLARRFDIRVDRARCHGLIGEGMIGNERVALIKPQTYMNLSGDCVQAAMHWYKVTPEQTLIISDDIDLGVGQLRVRPFGGAGTHNGWRDILQKTGSDRFPRIRVGVGSKPAFWNLADWVLSRYQGDDAKAMDECFVRAADAVEMFVRRGINDTMNVYNRKTTTEK